jgi:hypothetical protein
MLVQALPASGKSTFGQDLLITATTESLDTDDIIGRLREKFPKDRDLQFGGLSDTSEVMFHVWPIMATFNIYILITNFHSLIFAYALRMGIQTCTVLIPEKIWKKD